MNQASQTKRAYLWPMFLLLFVWLTCTVVIESFLLRGTRLSDLVHTAIYLLGLSASVVMVIVIQQTVCQLKLTNEQLAAARVQTVETNGMLQTIVDSIQAGIVMIDPSGQIHLTNQSFCAICNLDKSDLNQCNILNVLEAMGIRTVNGGILDVHKLPLEQVLVKAQCFSQVVSFSSYSNNNYYSMTINPVLSTSAGSCLGALFFINDITEQKTLEHLKDEFIGVVSHELKTPLTVIRGFSQLLQICLTERKNAIRELGLTRLSAETLIPRAEENCLNKTLVEIDRMSGMIDQMVQITRIDSGKMHLNITACDLAAVTQEVISRFQNVLGSERVNYDPGEPGIEALIDPNAFSQVLTNLISNAAKYSPADAPILVKLSRTGQWGSVTVTDKGIGIPVHEQKSIFSKFYRTYAAAAADADGLGLGLYITSRLVELQGGTIKLTSEPGCGSTFEARFPTID